MKEDHAYPAKPNGLRLRHRKSNNPKDPVAIRAAVTTGPEKTTGQNQGAKPLSVANALQETGRSDRPEKDFHPPEKQATVPNVPPENALNGPQEKDSHPPGKQATAPNGLQENVQNGLQENQASAPIVRQENVRTDQPENRSPLQAEPVQDPDPKATAMQTKAAPKSNTADLINLPDKEPPDWKPTKEEQIRRPGRESGNSAIVRQAIVLENRAALAGQKTDLPKTSR